jgi:hypothetical protein
VIFPISPPGLEFKPIKSVYLSPENSAIIETLESLTILLSIMHLISSIRGAHKLKINQESVPDPD